MRGTHHRLHHAYRSGRRLYNGLRRPRAGGFDIAWQYKTRRRATVRTACGRINGRMGVVTSGAANVVEVVVLATGPDALLHGRGPWRAERCLLLADEVRDERHHPGVREHRGGRVVRDQPCGRHRGVTARGKEVEEGSAEFERVHGAQSLPVQARSTRSCSTERRSTRSSSCSPPEAPQWLSYGGLALIVIGLAGRMATRPSESETAEWK